MQIHEITEGILKGVTNAVTSPIKGIYTTGKNAAKFAGQAVTRPGMDYFADKILNAAGIPSDPLIRGTNADELAAAADIKAAADKADKEAAKKAASSGLPPKPTSSTAEPSLDLLKKATASLQGGPALSAQELQQVNDYRASKGAIPIPAAPAAAPDPLTIPAYQRKGKIIPGVNAPATPTAPATAPVTSAPVATPQQSKIGVGQINKIIPSLRTRDLLSVKKNVDNTLAVKQKQPEPAITTATTKPRWTGRPNNLTKQQKEYINAIQRSAK